jgi:serine/threonine protein kinase
MERYRIAREIGADELDHPHVLTLIDSGAADGPLYYVLPYARGESLRARLVREEPLRIKEAVNITARSRERWSTQTCGRLAAIGSRRAACRWDAGMCGAAR